MCIINIFIDFFTLNVYVYPMKNITKRRLFRIEKDGIGPYQAAPADVFDPAYERYRFWFEDMSLPPHNEASRRYPYIE